MRYLPLGKITEEMYLAHRSSVMTEGLTKEGDKANSRLSKSFKRMAYTDLYVYEVPDEKWDCTGPSATGFGWKPCEFYGNL